MVTLCPGLRLTVAAGTMLTKITLIFSYYFDKIELVIENKSEKDNNYFTKLEEPVIPNGFDRIKIISELYKRPLGEASGSINEEVFLKQLADGIIGEFNKERFLSSKATPYGQKRLVGESKSIFNELESYSNFPKVQSLLLSIIKPELLQDGINSNWDEASTKKWEKGREAVDWGILGEIFYLTKGGLNPRDFEKNAVPFMQYLKEVKSQEEFTEYENSMRVFMRLMCGKRYEYSEQLKFLEKEAEDLKRSKGFDRSDSSESTKTESPVLIEPEIVLPLSEKDSLEKIVRDLSDKKRISYVLNSDKNMYIVPIRENPNISEKGCNTVVTMLARRVREIGEASSEKLTTDQINKKLLFITNLDSGSAVKNGIKESKEAYETRNSIYRYAIKAIKNGAENVR